ncbi:hypothetical protein ACQKCU_11120 [Heyndrickxia sporothermodurans]
MIILFISVIVFNLIAFYTNKRMSANQILHIWVFTIAFQLIFDTFIDLKYEGYWYFTKGIDWIGFPAYTILIPPVNMIYINWFPYRSSLVKKIIYIIIWEMMLLIYETISRLPEPWGYFHYGWWHLWYSLIINPFLLCSLLLYYKWILKLERRACER